MISRIHFNISYFCPELSSNNGMWFSPRARARACVRVCVCVRARALLPTFFWVTKDKRLLNINNYLPV